MSENSSSDSFFLPLWVRFKYIFIKWYIPIKFLILEYITTPKKINTAVWEKRPGDVAIVTGANRGYGFETVKRLLMHDYHVILAVRNVEFGIRAVKQIRESGINSGSASVQYLELTSFESVRKFAEHILNNYQKINLLFNNAGVGFVNKSFTEDGNVETFQVNYLSHFLLTNLLLNQMNETGKKCGRNSRIINMASVAQYGGDLNFQDLQSKNNYINSKVYFDSKLCVVAYTKFLGKQLSNEKSNVRVYSIHPGITPSSLWEKSVLIGAAAAKLLRKLFPKMDDTVLRVLNLAFSPDYEEINGAFFLDDDPRKCNPQADDSLIQNKLFKITQQLTQLNVN